jgi:hypothetical protein
MVAGMLRTASIASVLVFMLLTAGIAPASGEGIGGGLRRMVFDDWFQPERDEGAFSQGVATDPGQSGHPIENSITLTTTVWFMDANQPPRYTGTHDWRTFENWRKTLFTTTYGRRLTARFDAQSP